MGSGQPFQHIQGVTVGLGESLTLVKNASLALPSAALRSEKIKPPSR